MSLFKIASILGYIIGIAATIGLIRFNKLQKAYQPFIFIVTLTFINHVLSLQLVKSSGTNVVNANIFVLIESVLYTTLFYNWGLFKKRKPLFFVLLILILSTWILDNCILNTIYTTNSLFRIVSSFILVFLSIEQLNVLIVTAKRNVLYNSIFLICCGLLIYYSFKATIEVFFFIRLKASVAFYTNIFAILVYLNLVVNFIFIWATIWIPRRQKFTLLH